MVNIEGLQPENSYKKCARVAGDGCCVGETKMYLANGEIKTLKQLEEEGKSVEVFCVNDKNGKLERGIAHDFRITKYVNELYHIKLFNGEEIICTENHPFLMNNLEWKRADAIKRLDSFYNYVIKGVNERPCCENMITKEFIRLHHIGFGEVKHGMVVHHKDENPKNNEFKNLVKMTKKDHDKLHKSYEIGLNKGRDIMKNDEYYVEKTKRKNSFLAKEINKNSSLIKATKILRELEEKKLPLTLDNYNILRDETNIRYNYPKIEKMIKRGQISSFEDLVEIHNKGGVKLNFNPEEAYNDFEFDYEKENKTSKQVKKNSRNPLAYVYITFSNMVKYALSKGIEISRENCNEVFNMLSNEYKGKHIKDRKYGLGISLEKLEAGYNFEDVLNRFYYDSLIVKEVTVEKVNNVPVYDFAEDTNHNSLLCLGEINNRLSVIATHNSVLNL